MEGREGCVNDIRWPNGVPEIQNTVTSGPHGRLWRMISLSLGSDESMGQERIP
jgi:hypothetical protein